MGRNSGKRRKPKPRSSNQSSAALLRGRLDKLLDKTAWVTREVAEQQADLEALARGVDIHFFLATLCKATLAAPPEVQAQLMRVVPPWLKARGYAEILTESLRRGMLSGSEYTLAVNWLTAAGVETAQLLSPEQPDLFYRAYVVDDGSQAVVLILMYRDRRRRRVHGMGFLIDYNPPWEGAVKDVLVVPQNDPESVRQQFVERWNALGMPLQPIGVVEAKKRVLTALLANRRESIRLPRDLIAHRDLFIRCVPSLPDEADTPPFTPEDFATLSRTGKSPEELSEFEQKVGRFVRAPDGQKILVIGAPLDEESWF